MFFFTSIFENLYLNIGIIYFKLFNYAYQNHFLNNNFILVD